MVTATPLTPDTGTSTEPDGGRSRRQPASAASADLAALHAAVGGALAHHQLRYTSIRRAIVSALIEAGQPLTIPEVVAATETVPQSSVYRNLELFDEAGIVHRMPRPGDHARYELAEHLMGHHHHIVCSHCGAAEDIELPGDMEADLERVFRRIARQRGFALTAHRLDLVGDCNKCDERLA